MLDAMALLHVTDRMGRWAPERYPEHPLHCHGIIGRILADVPHRIRRNALAEVAQARCSGTVLQFRIEVVYTHPGKVAK